MANEVTIQGSLDEEGNQSVITAFSKLSHAVNSDYTPGKALQIAANIATVLLNASGASIILRDGNTTRLTVACSYQISTQMGPVLRALAKTSALKGVPVTFADLNSHDSKQYESLRQLGILAIASFPLQVGDRSIGAIIVTDTKPRPFPAKDIELLSAIANQVAIAVWKSQNYRASQFSPALEQHSKGQKSANDVALTIPPEKAELLELTNRKERELSTVYKVSEAVVSTIDLSKLLQVTMEQAMAAVGAGVGSIMLLDDDTGKLSIRVSKGVPKEYVESASVTLGEGISGWVALNGEGVLVDDPSRDKRFRVQEVRKDLTSAMSVPLRTFDKTVGVLNVSTILPNKAFDQRDLELLSTLANQMASAIENARLYDGLRRRSAQLSTALGVARTITATLDIVEVQSLLADQLCGIGQADTCVLLIFDNKTSRLRYGHGRGLRRYKKPNAYLALAQPMARRSISENRLIESEQLMLDNDIAKVDGINCGAAFPLKVQNRTVAVACLFSHEKKLSLSKSEIDMLDALCEPAGVAIENARVYQHQYKIARLLQKHLTPNSLEAPGLDVGHKYIPAHEVGGDYYDLLKVGDGNTGLLMADVAGSSVSAAVYTSMGKHVLRAYAREIISPSEVLTKVNRIIYEETEPELFISMFYGVYHTAERLFRYASGGHEPALLYRAQEATFDRLHAPGMLLGILPETDFEEREVKLQPGDIITTYTDGLTETTADGKQFGEAAIRDAIASCSLQHAQSIADNLYERLLLFADNRIVDDVGIVVIKAL